MESFPLYFEFLDRLERLEPTVSMLTIHVPRMPGAATQAPVGETQFR